MLFWLFPPPVELTHKLCPCYHPTPPHSNTSGLTVCQKTFPWQLRRSPDRVRVSFSPPPSHTTHFGQFRGRGEALMSVSHEHACSQNTVSFPWCSATNSRVIRHKKKALAHSQTYNMQVCAHRDKSEFRRQRGCLSISGLGERTATVKLFINISGICHYIL